jgi:hypothetical protein
MQEKYERRALKRAFLFGRSLTYASFRTGSPLNQPSMPSTIWV